MKIEKDKILVPLTTFRIGGLAKYFCAVTTTFELDEALDFAKGEKLPYLILGGGSNLLISDDGFAGLVIKLDFKKVEFFGREIECGAGASFSRIAQESVKYGLTGMEWAVGIPATIGGAVHNNCGAYGSDMQEIVDRVIVLRDEKIIQIDGNDCDYEYRHSIFKNLDNQDVILSVVLKLDRGNKNRSDGMIKEILFARNKKIPKTPSAGSVFKGVAMSGRKIKKFKKQFSDMPQVFVAYEKIPAGWLIDQCRLKGREIGGAQVSDQHANIIINTGEARATDVLELIELIKMEVRKKFGLRLEEEIEKVGF